MKNILLAGGGEGTIKNPLFQNTIYNGFLSTEAGGSMFLATVIPKVVGAVLVFGSVAFFFIFLSGSISWIASGGDKAHVEAAKGKITNALIGIILLFSSFAIIKFIEYFFGIDILSIDIGPLVIQ